MAIKEPLLKNKSVDEKLAEMQQETVSKELVAETQALSHPVEKIYIEKQQAMKKYGLVSPKKGSRVDIDQELHNRFKIAAIKSNKTQKEWLEEIIEEAVLKAEKKYERII